MGVGVYEFYHLYKFRRTHIQLLENFASYSFYFHDNHNKEYDFSLLSFQSREIYVVYCLWQVLYSQPIIIIIYEMEEESLTFRLFFASG